MDNSISVKERGVTLDTRFTNEFNVGGDMHGNIVVSQSVESAGSLMDVQEYNRLSRYLEFLIQEAELGRDQEEYIARLRSSNTELEKICTGASSKPDKLKQLLKSAKAVAEGVAASLFSALILDQFPSLF